MRRLIGTIAAGLLAGLSVLALELSLCRLTMGYAYPLSVGDRWAVVAHVRVLQQARLEKEGR